MRAACTLILMALVQQAECACTFPASLLGTWVTSGQGTWVINTTHILDFKTVSDSGSALTGKTPFTTLSFECHENRGDTLYVLRSESFEYFNNIFVSVYICMDFEEDSDSENKYIFYKATEEDGNGDQFTLQSTYENVCNAANYKLPYRYRVALKSGSETTALIQCPSAIFGSYTYDTCTDTSSNTTSMDVCDTRQQLMYNYTACDTKQMFSFEGTLDCLYFLNSGSTTYLTVYNRDNTVPDEVSYFRFICMAMSLSGSTVSMTVSPERCLDNQNTSAIASPGYAVTFTPYFLCPLTTDSSESLNILPYIIGAIAALLLIALIILIICCCRRRRRKKKQKDEESVNDSDDESKDGRSRPGSHVISRRSSRQSSKSSLDSGIEETPRTEDGGDGDVDSVDQVKEHVIRADGDAEVDNKTSRPASRQLSRMSDLPPSTIPPDEEQQIRGTPDEEQREDDDVTSAHSEKDETVEENGQSETDENPPTEQEEVKDEEKKETDESLPTESQEEMEDEEQEDTYENLPTERQEEVKDKKQEETDENLPTERQEQVTDEEQGDTDENLPTERHEQVKDEEQEKTDENLSSERQEQVKDEEQEDTDENLPAERQERVEDKEEKTDEQKLEEKTSTKSDNEDATKDNSEKEPDGKADIDRMDEENVIQETQSTKRDDEKSDTKGEPQKAPNDDENKEEFDDKVPQEEDRKSPDGERDGEQSDSEGPGGRRHGKMSGRHGGDGEGSGEEAGGYNTSDSEYQRELNRIGRKGGRHYQPSGTLTTVLVSRQEDEKKRTKLTKTKKQKTKRMTKLAQKRTRKPGDKGGKYEDEVASSDDEMRFDKDGNTAFMEQYRQKKRLEHILDEQHYWSDPDDVQDNFGRQSDASSLLSTEYDADEYEIIFDENGEARRVRKTKLTNGAEGAEDDEYEIIVGSDGTERRIKKAGGTGESTDISGEHAKKKLKSDDKLTNVEHPENSDGMDEKDDQHKTGKKYTENDTYDNRKTGDTVANTKLINVRGRPEDDEEGLIEKRRGKGGKLVGADADIMSDFDDTDMDKLSDVDSGLSEDDEPVDVILTQDQQQMIVNMLFDEDMNLRPQFERDEDGRIVRRLDNQVIYDPHTGRFTFLRRLGQLFKIPRLRRNDKGRPTGGYIQDDYGPKEVPKVKVDSGKRGRVGSGKSSGDPSTASPSADQKRSRTMEGKNVGFAIPDDDIESMNTDQLEYNKRGRRDIGSAIRRSLNKRLFRKKRKRGTQDVSPLPDVQLKKSWTGDSLSFVPGSGDMRGAPSPGTSPVFSRSGRAGSFMGTPGQHRRSTGAYDPGQLQRNREGLEHDRRILEKYYKDRPWETRQAFMESEGEGDFDDESGARQDMERLEHSNSFYRKPDGRLVIRETGCPELKHHPGPQKDQFFTIVRRRRDLKDEEVVREVENLRRRNIHTAPVVSQSVSERPHDTAHVHSPGESLDMRASEGGRMPSIDDNRLRRLLEELYKDKKYFDHYINATEPKSTAIVHSKGLAEHGRGYLLERADYWERRGPLPPRPPQTAAGWRMLRQQTMWASHDSRMNETSTTMTNTPTQESIPGTIESPRQGVPEQKENQNKDESIKFGDDPRSQDLKESEA